MSRVALAVALAALTLPVALADSATRPVALGQVSVSFTDATSCDEGGPGDLLAWDAQGDLAPGMFSALPSTHAWSMRLRAAGADGAYVEPESSSFTMTNARGSATLRFAGGSCADSGSAILSATSASGSGAWSAIAGTGAYRSLTGSGTYTFQAGIDPGTTNPYEIRLNGRLAPLQPSLVVDVERARWEPGVQDGHRSASVLLRVANVGPGDAFAVRVDAADALTEGAVPAPGSFPALGGDIPAGSRVPILVKYVVDWPCRSGDRGCSFDTVLRFRVPDALDEPALVAIPLTIRVPTND